MVNSLFESSLLRKFWAHTKAFWNQDSILLALPTPDRKLCIDTDSKHLHPFLCMVSYVRKSVSKRSFWLWTVTRSICDGFTPTGSYWECSPVRTLRGLLGLWVVPRPVLASLYCSQPRLPHAALPCCFDYKTPGVATNQVFLHIQNTRGVIWLEILVLHNQPEVLYSHSCQQKQGAQWSHCEVCEPGRREFQYSFWDNAGHWGTLSVQM